MEIPENVQAVLKTLEAAGHEAWCVGGCVRDALLGRKPGDWDVAASALPEETLAAFGSRALPTGLRHGTITVKTEGGPVEVTTYRIDGDYRDHRRPGFVAFTSSLDQDLARRDFTMNAIAMDLEGNLRDPFGGAADIERGLIRCVGEPGRRFREDGLRVMRALRFAAVFGYGIEEQTARAVHENRAMLGRVAAERINGELRRLLVGRSVGDILRRYPDVFCQFWPQLEPLVSLEQRNPWHCWGGWEHTVRAVEAAPADVTLRLAMLLHDIGKPACKSTDENGVDHFYGHPAVSAQLADEMLRALKFDNKTREQVVLLVERHGAQLPPESRVIRRWLNRLGPEAFFQLLEVKRADGMGQDLEKVKDRLLELDEIRAKAERILAEGQCLTVRDVAVNGRDVTAAGMEPGPEVGRTLERLLSEVLDGTLPNKRKDLLKRLGEIRKHT